MIQSIKHFAVNWTDGMKISERHLVAHDNFLIDTLRDANSLRCNNINYGLLPTKKGSDKDESIFDVITAATKDIQIVIRHCSAITPAGYRIEMSNHSVNTNSLIKNAEGNATALNGPYYILISCNPFERVPFGDIDVEETPPRHPFTTVKYNIDLLPESIVQNGSTGGNYTIIGKVNFNEGTPVADKEFIPPCTAVLSHPKLVGSFADFAKIMGDIQQHARTIVQKTNKTDQNTTLTSSIKLLCTTVINYFSNVYFHYRNIVPQQPPAYLVEVFSSMALNIHNCIQLMPSTHMEEMLKYAFEWSEIAPHTLTNQLSAVAEINYDHNKCGQHLNEIRMLLSTLQMIFNKLSDLDYIGQRKENIIVNEKDITPASSPKMGWSLLD